MLDILSDGFKKARESFSGQTTLSEDNISEALETVSSSLLEADVEYAVAKKFVSRVKDKLIGQTVSTKAGKGSEKIRVGAKEHFVKACQEELEALMGPVDTSLKLPKDNIAKIMMVGLQGSGKTTSTGKICHFLKESKGRKTMLVAADIYRPAAIDQLKVLGERLGVEVYSEAGAQPTTICENALRHAQAENYDCVIFDTAGRLTVDDVLMQELEDIKRATQPTDILFVCDAMMGQDAVTTADAFHQRLDISGVVITKLDGDARGGAALSIKEITGRPIKFLGMGEDLSKLEEFRPEGLSSRILGMGDVVGLMQDFEKVASEDSEEQAMRMLKGQFSFNDFYDQIKTIQKMGSLKDIAGKLPIGDMLGGADLDDKQLIKIRAMIDSMTKEERIKPGVLNPSRVSRIAKGSGTNTSAVNQLIKQFSQMRKMMGMMSKNMGLLSKLTGGLGGIGQMRKMAQAMGGMGGGAPAGMADLFGMGAGGNSEPKATKQKFDRDKQKKLRKQARRAKRKNRKK